MRLRIPALMAAMAAPPPPATAEEPIRFSAGVFDDRPPAAGVGRESMRKWCTAMFLAALVSLAGCVERALVITSEPTGADVTVNQQWKGKTPYVLPFKHYGVYDIWIEHPGYEENGKMVKFYPMHVGEPVKAPGYQYAGADFVTEVLLPTTLRDQHNLHYVLERVDQADDIDDVLARASQLRGASLERTRLRYEKDEQRGRRRGIDEIDDDPAGQYVQPETTQPQPQFDGQYYYDSEIDATPPLPSEMPVFVP